MRSFEAAPPPFGGRSVLLCSEGAHLGRYSAILIIIIYIYLGIYVLHHDANLLLSKPSFTWHAPLPIDKPATSSGRFIAVMSSHIEGPPAGIDLSENRNTETIVAVIALILLGVGAMALRMVSRRYTPMPEGLHPDDWYLMIAMASNFKLEDIIRV